MKGGNWSIHWINRLLVILFFVTNVLLVWSMLYFNDKWSRTMIEYFMYSDIIINVVLIYIYLYFNNRYLNDFEKLTDFFKNYLEDKGELSVPIWTSFLENKKIETLFKKAYIKWNLMKKDYTDFQKVFDMFIPKDIYTKIWYKWHEKIELWNCISKRVTIMFLDIMWFTKLSEKMTPERSLLLLNIYFDWIWDIVYKSWGYIDKFLWDWIMIIFEHESSDEALKCAIDIMTFISKFRVSIIWSKISIWIWINTWEVIMGTIWTKKRMDVTVIWDNVNVASRLQWLTRKYWKKILLSQNTYDTIKNKTEFNIERIWDEHLDWKEKTVVIYSMDDSFQEPTTVSQ